MKLIRKTLVMLCVFVLGYVIIKDNFVLASEETSEYTIELKETIIRTRENERPNYEDYVIVKDPFGNDITKQVVVDINDKNVNYQKEGPYRVLISVYISQINDYLIAKPLVEVIKDKKPEVTGYLEKYYFSKNYEITEDDILKDIEVYDDFTENPEMYIENFAHINWKIGSNIIYLVAKDDANNETKIKLEVVIEEVLPPLISENEIEVQVFEEVDLKDLLEIDELYLDRINIIVNDDDGFRSDILGEYNVNYHATFYNLSSTKNVKVKVVDKIKPQIMGLRKITIEAEEKFDINEYFTFKDNYDNKNDIQVSIIGDYNTNKPGEYYLTVFAKDLSGNVSYYDFTLIVEKKSSSVLLWILIILGVSSIGVGGTYLYLRKVKRDKGLY